MFVKTKLRDAIFSTHKKDLYFMNERTFSIRIPDNVRFRCESLHFEYLTVISILLFSYLVTCSIHSSTLNEIA